MLHKLLPIALLFTASLAVADTTTVGGSSIENLSTDLAKAFQTGSAYSFSMAYGYTSEAKWKWYAFVDVTPTLYDWHHGYKWGWSAFTGASLDSTVSGAVGFGGTLYKTFSPTFQAFIGVKAGQATSATQKLNNLGAIDFGATLKF